MPCRVAENINKVLTRPLKYQFRDNLRLCSMIMNAAVITLVLCAQVVLIPCGLCRPQVTSSDLLHSLGTSQALQPSRSVQKRQTACENATQRFTQNYPQECMPQFGMQLSFSLLLDQDASTLTTAFMAICQQTCVTHFLHFFSQCQLSLQAEALIGLCAQNTDGRSCYEDFSQLIPDVNEIRWNCTADPSSSTCTPSCRNALLTSVRNGCCVNVFNSSVFSPNSMNLPAYEYDLWSGCNVTTPGFCLTPGAAEATDSVKILLFLLTLTAMAMLLVWRLRYCTPRAMHLCKSFYSLVAICLR